MYKIEILKEDEFYNFGKIWNSLLERSNNKNLFSLYEWQKNFWRYFKRGLTLFVLLCRRGKEVVGVFPLVIDRTKTVKFLGSGISDYLDLICEKEEEEKILNSFFEFLFSNSSLWNLIKLENIPENSSLLKYNIEGKNFFILKSPSECCPYIILPETYQNYLKSLGKKTRFNLNYYRRLLHRNFKTEFKTISRYEELEETILKFFELHKKRWLKKKMPGMLYTEKRRNFQKEVAGEFFKKNILRIYTLSLDGETVAVLYGFLYCGKFYYYLSGFNPSFSSYSVGTVLTSYAIEKAIEEKAEIFDFLRGDEEYKYRFGCVDKFNYNLYIAKKEIKSFILSKMIIFQKNLENFIKKTIR